MTYAMSAFEAGASGYVLKHSAPYELTTAINKALKGERYISPQLAGADDLLNGVGNKSAQASRRDSSHLTPRQKEVLQLLAEGFSVKEAADQLHISSRTVEYHKYQMMRDIGVKSTAELVRYALKHGIVGE
jgi:DNA-binding NarL/FixJ family response regulator